ncbi:MAG: phage portal protein, partial [Thermoguttaceae bacterium]|nr:phage portal protein [Thermoguttaceae bacterium]
MKKRRTARLAGGAKVVEAYDPDGDEWRPLGTLRAEKSFAIFRPENEHYFNNAREISRELCRENPFAVNALENRVNFAVGFGHKYQTASRVAGDEDLAKRTQDVLVDFIFENDWFRRQQEILRRYDRDGEAFLRFFCDGRGKTIVRFVEPEEIFAPPGALGAEARFGVLTSSLDAETVQGYYVGGKLIAAEKIQHRKANVDSTVRRGLPLLHPVRENLRRAQKLLRNMSVVAEIQSSIAMIRKHSGASPESIRRFVRERTRGAEGDGVERFRPGTIVDANAGVEYEFPIAAVDAGRYVQILQAELRAVAARLTLPEYMLTADASNANYSSTAVAEGPATRCFERLQHELIRDDMKVMRRVVRDAIARGELPEDVASRVSIRAIPPSLAAR